MLEITTIIVSSATILYAVVVGAAWCMHQRSVETRDQAPFARTVLLSALFPTVVTSWTIAGIAAFLFADQFWRGAWVGGSAVLWFGYAPVLIHIARGRIWQPVGAQLSDSTLAR